MVLTPIATDYKAPADCFRDYHAMCDAFLIQNGLEQVHDVSSLLFDFALEHIIMKVQRDLRPQIQNSIEMPLVLCQFSVKRN